MTVMAAILGLSTNVESEPGVFEDAHVEINVSGQLNEDRMRWDRLSTSSDSVQLAKKFSVILDTATVDISTIAYVKIGSVRWSVTGVTIQPPRVIMTLGSVFK